MALLLRHSNRTSSGIMACIQNPLMLQPGSPQLKSHSHLFTFRDKLLPKTTRLRPPIHFTSRQKEPGTHHTGLSGPFDMQVPGWGVQAVQAQSSKRMGKHMQNTAADLIPILIQRHGDLGQVGRKSQQKVPEREL